MSKKDLIPLRPSDELDANAKQRQKEIQRKGAFASHKARAQKKKLKELMLIALPMKEKNTQIKQMMRENGWPDGDITQAVVMVQGLIMKAKQGDVSAFNAVRDLIGEKPVDEVQNTLNTSIDIGFVDTGKDLAGDEDEIED